MPKGSIHYHTHRHTVSKVNDLGLQTRNHADHHHKWHTHVFQLSLQVLIVLFSLKNKHKTGQSLGNLLLNTSAWKTRESLFFFSQSVLAWDTFLSIFCPRIDQPRWRESSILTLSEGHTTCHIWCKHHIFQTSAGFLVHLSITLKQLWNTVALKQYLQISLCLVEVPAWEQLGRTSHRPLLNE